jgi:hypothetical protein
MWQGYTPPYQRWYGYHFQGVGFLCNRQGGKVQRSFVKIFRDIAVQTVRKRKRRPLSGLRRRGLLSKSGQQLRDDTGILFSGRLHRVWFL